MSEPGHGHFDPGPMPAATQPASMPDAAPQPAMHEMPQPVPQPSTDFAPAPNDVTMQMIQAAAAQATQAAALATMQPAVPVTAQLPGPTFVVPIPTPTGRRYGFLCGYCSSRLEATDSMAGQSGTCPTCGKSIVIPILDNRGRLIDPTSGQIIKQDPHPVHAYAAAGHRAPQIVPVEGQETPVAGDDRRILCPRCKRLNAISANNCLGCGLPFTMEGTVGDAISGTNTWAVASLVLGIVGVVGGFCFLGIPPILALVFGGIAMKGMNQSSVRQSGQGMAIAGLILGVVGLLLAGLFFAAMIHR